MRIHAPSTFCLFLACAALASAAPLPLSPLVAGLDAPVEIVNAGDGSGRLFVLEKRGRIRVIRDGALWRATMLDLEGAGLNGDERGLLGLAFHPRFATTRYLFLNYTRDPDGATVIARYTVPASTPDLADPASVQVLLTIPQPYANHNGGSMRFGRDGYLYLG